MAGLLDFLSTDDARLGLGLLAAGGPTTDPNRSGFGQRIAGAVQGVQAQKANDLQSQYIKSQIAENASQDALRRQQLAMAQRKQSMQEGLLGYGAPAGGQAQPSVPGLLSSAPAPGGAAAVPGAAPTAPPPNTPVQTPRGPMTLQQLSQAYQIPYESLAFDMVNNDGKGIAEMVFKRGTPDMQVQNGYAFDKNRLGAGYLPQLNISSNGQATQVQIGPDGQPVISAPQGAVNTFGAYQGASNRSAADYQPERVIDPGTGRTVVQPRSQVLQPAGAPLIGPGSGAGPVNGNPIANPLAPRAGDTDRTMIFTQERRQAAERLQRAQASGDPAQVARAQADIAAIEQEIRSNRIPMPDASAFAPSPLIGPGAGRGNVQPAMAGNVVELSPAELAANKANEARAVDTAKAGVVRDTSSIDQTKKVSQMREAADAARKLLDAGPTGSGAGALTDNVLNFVGQPTSSGTAAQQLEALGGALMANVPRMEGPQSDADVRNYKLMAGNVGDRTLPVESRKAALRTVIELQDKYAAMNGGAPAGASAAPSLPAGWSVKVK